MPRKALPISQTMPNYNLIFGDDGAHFWRCIRECIADLTSFPRAISGNLQRALQHI